MVAHSADIAAPPPSDELRARTLGGLSWTAAAKLSQQALQLTIGILLARELVPADFGLVGLVTVFTGFAAIFVDFGFSGAVIQRRELSAEVLTSAFFLNVAFGLVLTALTFALAPAIAAFYHQDKLIPITHALSFVFIISALGILQSSLLERVLNFRRVAVIETASAAIAGGVAVAMAFLGAGVWSIVALTLCGAGIRTALLWVTTSWRPGLRASRAAVGELWHFSSNLAGTQAANYWIRNADNLLVGRFLGADALGIYSRAYALMLAPLQMVGAIASRVMFPSLASIQDDRERIRATYLRAIAAIALVMFPIITVLFVLAGPLITLLLGTKWKPLIPVFAILCVPALIQSITTTVGWIYQAVGRTDLWFRWVLGAGGATVAAFVVGLHWGVKGVAAAYAIRTIVIVYFNLSIPGKLIGMSFRDVWLALRTPLTLSFTVGGVVWVVRAQLVSEWSASWLVPVSLLLAACLYLALVHVVRPSGYLDLREMAANRKARGAV